MLAFSDRGRHCSACGATGVRAGGEDAPPKYRGSHHFPKMSLGTSTLYDGASFDDFGGEVFATFSARVAAVKRRRWACAHCNTKPTYDNCRAQPWISGEAKLPPLLVMELPDGRAQERFEFQSRIRVDDQVHSLTINLVTGEPVRAHYRLLAVGLISQTGGGVEHYCVDERSTGAWMRVDGMVNGGAGLPCDAPAYDSGVWYPIIVVYERLSNVEHTGQ